ncbi:hypothetical protein TIFTF001_029832 [Ficus carica]|uniref:Uncharacterized protein n=1 Tax=Ficus carica TaxID=3494 RepID=A0AA88DT35_FICCA|nr:hypothetical protein TIFTF001_029832 [Ficus carica]
MERREDCSDDVIDGLMKLLEGDVILCSATDSDERNDELRSSHISLDPTIISRSFLASSAYEQMFRASTPVVWQRQHLMPTSPTSLDLATALRYSGGDNFEFQQHPSQDERIRDGGEYGHDGVVGMKADVNIEYVKNYEGRSAR